jgi:hypothetical protein
MRQGQVIITGSMLAAAFTASESAHAGSAVAAATFGGAAGVMFGAAVARPLLTAVVVYEPAPINVEAPRRPVCYVGCLWETGYLSGSRAVRVCHWPFRRDASEFTKCTGAQERPGVRPSEGAG